MSAVVALDTAETAAGDVADIEGTMRALGRDAKATAHALAIASPETKATALRAMAAAIRENAPRILDANAIDMSAASARGLRASMLDRLKLDDQRIEAMAAGLEDIAAFDDPVGEVMAAWSRPNGLRIERVRVPIGVIGVIYESRPNVTADAGGLCLKAGNAAILRGGSESVHSTRAIHACLQHGLDAAGLPRAAIQLVPTTDRAAVGVLLKMAAFVDVIVPRGGKSLIERVQTESRVPVFAHLEGLCHTYVDAGADLDKARAIIVNAKMRRTGICGATETVLVDDAIAGKALAPIVADLIDAGCAVRGDAATQAVDERVEPAEDADWTTEYLEAIVSVGVVDGVGGAIAHINANGSNHTDAIVTEDAAAADRFLREVDSAIVMHNTSTQFADGGEFGMGAEIGIATGKLHARGPVGAEQLTSFKYLVRGTGQVRP